MGLGLSAADILHFYENLGPAIFAGNRLARGLRRVGFAKYHAQPLRQALEATFGEKTLGESRTRLVIPSLNLETGEVHIHKTAHHPRFEVDYKERAVDVALATLKVFRSSTGGCGRTTRPVWRLSRRSGY